MDKSNKVKNYSTIGIVLILLSLAQQIFISAVFFFASGKDFLPALAMLNVFWILINPFFIIGIILLWRADKNRVPPKKTIWFHIVVAIYLILIFSLGIFAINTMVKRSKKDLIKKTKVIKK